MKILLLNTNQMKPACAPIGLDYVADKLIEAGHEPKLLDLCFSKDVSADIGSEIAGFDPRLIGVTVRNTDECYMSGAFFLPFIKEVIECLRKHSNAPIAMGGAGFSVIPEAVMQFCRPDYGVAGEGEEAFPRLAKALMTGSGVESVPNLLYWEGNTLQRNPTRYAALDDLPRTRSFLDNALYFREGGQAGIETKRGCHMTCVYCADPLSKGRHVRLRSPKRVVDELKSLLAQGIDHIHTCDCEFNVPGDHAKDICRAIVESGIADRIRWYAYCSIMPFDEEMADLFKRAGCAGVDFGADSGDDTILKRLGRTFRSEDLVRTAGLCHKHGIAFMYDLLIGSPGETRETVRETIDLMRRIDADCAGLSMGIRIYNGTAIAEWVRSQGDFASNPDIYGAKQDNADFLRPVFYVAPDLGAEMASIVSEMVGDDRRFFMPSIGEADYNYNDNTVLVRAIASGARGAYWNILRRHIRE
jgi:tryptophan 2-C-methyltransferase